MSALSNRPPALALKLKRGSKKSAGLEIIDAATGEVAALIPDGKLAGIVAALLLASPDLLWANLRARDHLANPSAGLEEKRRLLRLLSEAQSIATQGQP